MQINKNTAQAMDAIMKRVQPVLEQISFIFGRKTTCTLVVQYDDSPGALVFSPKMQAMDSLIQALRESEKISKNQSEPIDA